MEHKIKFCVKLQDNAKEVFNDLIQANGYIILSWLSLSRHILLKKISGKKSFSITVSSLAYLQLISESKNQTPIPCLIFWKQ